MREAELHTGLARRGKYTPVQYPVPSISSQKELFEGYLPSKGGGAYDNRFPIAGYVAYDNVRIQSQLGTFTVFGLDNDTNCYGEEIEEDKVNKETDYSKCSLADMQKMAEEQSKTNSSFVYKQFLEKVLISGDAKKSIADSIRVLGITKARLFPELENLSKELSHQISQYLSIIDKK